MKTLIKICINIRPQFLLLISFVLFQTVAFSQLNAGISATPTSGCPPLVVSFKDSSTGNPNYWKWDLGNGTISYLKDPTTTYFNSGSYNIKLIVKNEDGEDSIVKNKFIVVNAVPVAKFGSSNTSGCFPLGVHFTDSSLAGSGTITEWKWDFGDGTLSNEQNPFHTYYQAGNFTVVLRVTNSNGCTNVITKTSYIKIQNGVKADFSYRSQGSCSSPVAVNFTNKSIGTGVVNYSWDFGDGKKSVEKNPIHSYQFAGVYTVTLIATNSFGCSDTLIKRDAINIGFVKADFVKSDTVCANADFVLKNTSNPSTFVGSFWNFGDNTFSDSINPIKKYTDPGTYQIKLVTDFGACKDSVSKAIIVLPQPVVSFAAINNTSCSTPLAVTFNNTNIGAVSYLWNFGDNTTSTSKNPVYTYKKAGEYTVTLTIKSTSGCYGTLVKESFVKIIPPKIVSLSNVPVKGCVPFTATPEAVIKDSVPGTTYLWSFGDGITSASPKPSHTYTTPGNYNIKLIITTPSGCTDSLTVVKAVQAGTAPVAEFSADPLDICANTAVNFTDASTGATPDKWLWKFGDGGSSTKQNHAHLYNSIGKFSVTLIVSNFGCSDTLKKVNYINVRPPIAKFDTAFLCNDPLDRTFIDRSLGAKTWLWDFGDGTTSAVQKASHTYAKSGTYSVSLKVTNGACEHTLTKDVVVINDQGILESSAAESCANTGVTFNLKNVDSSNISSYQWYFNGILQNGTQNLNNPVTYIYDSAGSRQPAVVITDLLKCSDTLYTSVPLAIYGPKAAFGSLNSGTCFGNTINFIDSTKTDGKHAVTEWKWDFGEGNEETYTKAPFSHNYSAVGTYNVKLVVMDSYGCIDSLKKDAFVSVTKPVARFVPSDSVLCVQSPITFNNYSEGVGLTYFWHFGDGDTSGEVEPIHTFNAPGIYTVRMRIVDRNGCSDSATFDVRISTATIDFSLSDSFSTCPPLIVNATNHSSSASYNWDFGDGGNSQLVNPSHIYTYPGIYNIKLIINTNGGCYDSLSRKVVIEGPTAVLDYTPKEGCRQETVNFTLKSQKAVSYIWDYNDGTTIVTDKATSSHTYTSSGIYVPKIILQDINQCKVPLQATDTIKIDGIETHFNSNARQLCDSGFISFNDSTVSNAIVNNWLWDFGDGTTSTAQSPKHKFTDTGFYTISLISKTKFGCADTAVTPKYIKVVSSPSVKITGDTAACEPAQLTFRGELLKTDTSELRWNWIFGNGKTSDVQIPGAQTYASAGTYPVVLKATNSSGCYDSVVQKAIIHPKPPVNAGADTAICKSSSFTLHATGANSFTWTSAPSLSCTNCATPTAKPDQTITYYLSGKSVYGCIKQDSIKVEVQQPFKISVSKNDTVCLGESIVLKASGAQLYEWIPSTYLDNANTATPKSTPASSITYKVVGKDRMGCFKDEGKVDLKVYPKPAIEITNGESIVVQAGGNVRLVTKSSPDVINWKWYPGKWLSCDSCAQPLATPGDNITYHVTATNIGHCEAHDDIAVSIICNNANIYVPNTFSPNHDGSNDVFYPRGTGLYSIKSFKVFNRWGQIVFSKNGITPNDPQSGWDGTLNGALLQPDVYVYVLEVICSNNVTLPVKGNVTLIR